jgi:hypothetical protein
MQFIWTTLPALSSCLAAITFLAQLHFAKLCTDCSQGHLPNVGKDVVPQSANTCLLLSFKFIQVP